MPVRHRVESDIREEESGRHRYDGTNSVGDERGPVASLDRRRSADHNEHDGHDLGQREHFVQRHALLSHQVGQGEQRCGYIRSNRCYEATFWVVLREAEHAGGGKKEAYILGDSWEKVSIRRKREFCLYGDHLSY